MAYSNETEISKFQPNENLSSSVSQRMSTYALELMKWWNGSPHENQQKDSKQLPDLALTNTEKNYDKKGGFSGDKFGSTSSIDSNENSKKFSKGEYQSKDADLKKPSAEDFSITKGKDLVDHGIGKEKKNFAAKEANSEAFVKTGSEDISKFGFKKSERLSIEMESQKVEHKLSKITLPNISVSDY